MIFLGFCALGAFAKRDLFTGDVCPSSSRARFLVAALLSGAFLAVTPTVASHFEDPETVFGCFLIWLVEFVPALLGAGVATDADNVMFGMIRLGNSTLVEASV